jgi:NitT/TauT family transport system ATP-binding protein
MISVNIVEKNFGNGTILKDISFRIKEGSFVTVLGPSGCGKSTLLRCIGGFESFTGEVQIEGKKITRPNKNAVMVFQDFHQLYPWLSIRDNVLFALNAVSKGHDGLREKAEASLKTVGLSDFMNYYPNQLSGGMKQRAAIARALAMNPKILLMDEPFGSLDAQTRTILQKELLDLWEEFGMTIIFITHNIQEAIILGDTIFVMSSQPGRVKGTYTNTIERPRRPDKPGFTDLWHELYDSLDIKRFE